jgi:hypothetical protein
MLDPTLPFVFDFFFFTKCEELIHGPTSVRIFFAERENTNLGSAEAGTSTQNS